MPKCNSCAKCGHPSVAHTAKIAENGKPDEPLPGFARSLEKCPEFTAEEPPPLPESDPANADAAQPK